MKTFLYKLLHIAVILCWFLVLTFIYAGIFISNAGKEEGPPLFIAAMGAAIITIVVFRYWRKKRKENQSAPAPVPQTTTNNSVPASPNATARAEELVNKVKTSANPFETYQEVVPKISELQDQGAKLGYNPYDSMRAHIALDFINKGETPPQAWSDMFAKAVPISFQKNERVVYLAQYWSGNTFTNERRYQAGSRGVGIHVAKGLTFRLGRVAGRSVNERVNKGLGQGAVIATTKNFYYFDNAMPKKIPINKIVGLMTNNEKLEIMPEGARAQPLIFKLDNEVYAMIMKKALSANWQ